MSNRHSIDPTQAFRVAGRIIDTIEKDGGVDAVILDVKANHGIDLDPKVVRDIMACGGVCILMILGHGVKAGLLKLEGPDGMVIGGTDGAPKSAAPEESTTLDAERAASEAIARIRKLH